MAGTRRLTDLLNAAQADLRLPDGPLVLGLSGGADSAGLGAMVTSLGRTMRAVHVDHGLLHSPVMRTAAEDVAGRLAVELEVVEVDVTPGPSPEGRARSARYRGLNWAIRPEESVLTAHTAEDNLETVLINLLRGTGLRGLAGIPRYREPRIFRPALGVSRSLLREVAQLSDLAFVDDPMNLDPGLTRNYLRMEVMPRLAVLNPNFVETVTRMTESLREDADYFEGVVRETAIDLTPGMARCPIGILMARPATMSNRVMMRMLEHVAGGSAVSSDRVKAMRAVLRGDAEKKELGGGAVCRRQGPFLEVRAADVGVMGTRLLPPGSHRIGGLVLEVSAREQVCRVAPLGKWHAIFPKECALEVDEEGVVLADGEPAWVPGDRRLPHAWYLPGTVGYLCVFAREESGWT